MSSSPAEERSRAPLNPRERRVLGVLIEKQKTTPEYYPMSVAAIVTGCNQKSNRDPVTNYDADDVEDTLHDLRQKGVTVLFEGSGRVVKWKHSAYEWLDLKGRPVEMAILAELLLRGPQTEGELRGRASRMDAIADLATLQEKLADLADRGLVVYLTPPGQKRGVVVTHGLYPPEELERLRQVHAQGGTSGEAEESRPSRGGGASAEIEAIRAEVGALRDAVRTLADELRALKETLGA